MNDKLREALELLNKINTMPLSDDDSGRIVQARVRLNEALAASKPEPQDTRLCHANGDKCLGCDHYHGKAPVCSYAKQEPQAQADKIEQGMRRSKLIGNSVEGMMESGLSFTQALDATLRVYDHNEPQAQAGEQSSNGLELFMMRKERDDARMAVTMLRTAIANALTDYEDDGDVDGLIAELKEIV